MLVIRKDQMEVLDENTLASDIKMLAEHMRREFPEKTADMQQDQLNTLIRDGIEKAGDYGITFDDDVCEFIECMIEYGHDFDTNPKYAWARSILTDKDLHGDEKMTEIKEQEPFMVRERV